MVPRLAAQGTSFRGAYLYYFHDKDALSQNRVAWTKTINLLTEKVEKAWKVMAFTAKHQEELKEASGQKRSGAKLKKPVLAYSLSWHPEQKPDRKTMMEAAYSSLAELGLEEHEAMVACHIDEPQPHLHVVVNKAHPRTGLVANLRFTKRKLQSWARDFQEREGTMYCPKREENHAKRQKGKFTHYGDPKIIEAWERSTTGRGFQEQLKARGYELAQGRKRLVIVDPYGKTLNPLRMLPEVKADEFHQRVAGINPQSLPTSEAFIKEPLQEIEKQDDSTSSPSTSLPCGLTKKPPITVKAGDDSDPRKKEPPWHHGTEL